jgi:hypothetical protein
VFSLSNSLIKIKDFNIKTFLDIGTFSGATISIITIYLTRFGIVSVQTIDVNKFIHSNIFDIWKELSLPITYTLMENHQKFTDCMINENNDIIFKIYKKMREKYEKQ